MSDTPSTPDVPAVNPEGFRASPNGHVYGIVDDPERDVPAVTADLLALHMPVDGIHIYCCNEGADALDLGGTKHGLLARIKRLVGSVAYEDGHLERIEAELQAGHALIGVAVGDDQGQSVASVLHSHGGHDVVHYGKHTWQRLGPQTKTASDDSNG